MIGEAQRMWFLHTREGVRGFCTCDLFLVRRVETALERCARGGVDPGD